MKIQLYLPVIFIFFIPTYVLSGVIKREQEFNQQSVNNFFSYLEESKDSFFSFYENARLFTNILQITNAPLMESIKDFISPETSLIGRSIKSFDGIVNNIQDSISKVGDYVPKTINTWMVPQILEKLSLIYEDFMSSSLGKSILDQIDLEKLKKIFSDEKTGEFSYDRFVELLENHSFRKHWINEATKKIKGFISFYADPKTHEKYMSTTLNIVNNFIQKFNLPKANLNNLDETIISSIDYIFKNDLFYPIKSENYIKPLMNYIQNLIKIFNKTMNHEEESEKLEDTLTNTINMDIIEPTLRVNRAYRFVIENPHCDRYVMCLVNSEEKDDPSLPGVKKALSKSASLVASWFLAGKTRSSFTTLYGDIMEINNCKEIESRNCLHFHVEEMKVKKPYVHREL